MTNLDMIQKYLPFGMCRQTSVHVCLIWEFKLNASCFLVLFEQVRHVAGVRGGCDKLMIDDTPDI